MYKIEEIKNKIICGDALEVLKKIPDESVDCIITSPPYWCLSEDTEVLTDKGFKNISEIKKGDKVLSVNPVNMKLEWDEVVEVGKWMYEGKMIHFRGQQIDLIVTPNHKMFAYLRFVGKPIRQRNHVNGRYYFSRETFFIEAKDVRSGYITPVKGFKWEGNKVKYFILPGLKTIYNKQKKIYPPLKIKIEDWLAFFGIYLAEGSVRGSRGGGKKSYEICIKQKLPKAKIILKLLKKLPFKFSVYKSKDLVNFSIVDRQLWEYLKQFGNSHQKYIPSEIKELSPNLLKILLKWYLLGDGRKRGNKWEWHYGGFSVSKKLLDDLIEISLKIGENLFIYKDNKNFHFVYRKTAKLKDSYSEIFYKGNVYGVETKKNHTICVRRNGKTLFTGNSCRSYLPEDNENKKFEIGLEDHPQQYIDKIVKICLECVRVLKKSGVFFLNLGDVFYTASHQGSWQVDRLNKGWQSSIKHRINARGKYKSNWLQRKGRLLLPMRIAITLQEKGIMIRDVIIWVKKLTKYPERTSIGTAIPFPVKDRLLPAFEYIFQIVKSPKYYFNLEPVKNELKISSIKRFQNPIVDCYPQDHPYKKSLAGIEKFRKGFSVAREGTDWNIKLKKELTKANPTNAVMFSQGNQFTVPGGHYAKFPEALVEFFLLVGCPEDGIVLDPFMGSGTTAVVAKKLGRNFIGIELNPEYVKIAEERIKNVPENLF
jgi:DNA modification methylase